jgi:hypothetical protein
MNDKSIKNYFPDLYAGCVETDTLCQVEDELISLFEDDLEVAMNNQFIETSNEDGIRYRELRLGISANTQTEDVQFRRDRLMGRYTTSPPFTLIFFKQRLNDIVGKNNWELNIDYNERTLYVETSATNQNWYQELEFTINYLKPVNMVFVNVPRISNELALSEQISYTDSAPIWNYRMRAWRLGLLPFASRTGGGILKLPTAPSIKSKLLENTAGLIITDIHSAKINNSIVITDFEMKSSLGDQAIVEYEVTPAMTGLVTNVKLLDSSNNVLTESQVYVPVTQTIRNKHIIKVKEG